MDISWDTLTETAIQSILVAGPMNGSSNAYNAIATQYTSSETKAKYKADKLEIEGIRESLKDLDLDENARQIQHARTADIMRKWGSEYAGETEVAAILGGKEGLKDLIQANLVKSDIYRKAGIDPRDSSDSKNTKLEKYKASLPKADADNLTTRLKAVESKINGIYAGIESGLDIDAMSEGGAIYRMYGEKGLGAARKRLQEDPRFKDLSNKQKTIAIHNQMKADFENKQLTRAKNDNNAKRYVDQQVYGYVDGAAKTKKGKERKRRKLKAEDAAYRAYASKYTAQSSRAITIAQEGDVAAGKLLNEDQLKNLKIDPQDSPEAMAEYIRENANDLGVDDVEGTVAKILDGKIKALVSKDGNYITYDKEGANARLAEGDLLQSTAIMHEMSHAQDALAMGEGDISDFAQQLEADSQKNRNLRDIDTMAKNSMSGVKGDARYIPGKPMNQQTALAQDEYTKRFQDFLRHSEPAMKAARKQGAGIGNLFRGFKGGDFKRRMKPRLADSQTIDAAAKRSEESGRNISAESKRASAEIQGMYEDIKSKIDNGTLEGGEFVELASKFEAYVNGLVNRFGGRRPKIAENRADIVSRILYEDKRGVMGLIKSYNEDINDSLAAYVFQQLNPRGREGRAKEIVDAVLPKNFDQSIDTEEGTTDIVDTSQDIDFDDRLQEEMRAGRGLVRLV